MKIKLDGNTILIVEADNVQFAAIKSWGKMKWNKRLKQLEGPADIELLDKLAKLVRLPPHIETYRTELHQVQDAVDWERSNQNPVPVFNYPVKLPLYQHQIRAANMALLVFGLIAPEEAKRKEM